MCGDNDKFSEIRGSMPNSVIVSASVRMGPSDCEVMGKSNCSCTTFASFRDDGTGCELYYGDKNDLLNVMGKDNGITYIRGDAPRNSGKGLIGSDTLRPGDSLRNNDILVSAGGLFELGFFGTGGSSSNHYFGIWFKNDKHKKAVWVANRDNPILDDSGVLTIRSDGNMVITDIRLIPIIVNYGMLATSSNTSMKLLDSGNLILVDGEEKIVWQSFYYPSDTFLPDMKLGLFDLHTDYIRKQFLVSWLSPLVPTTGPFTLGLDWNNRTLFNAWRRDGVFQHIGFWDGHSFRFFFQTSSDSYNFTFVSTSKEIYLTFTKGNNNFSWFMLTSTGEINEFTMLDKGTAIVNHTLCEGTRVSQGCLIPMPSMCGDNDKFSEIRGSMPNSVIVSASVRMGPSDCEVMCRSNCSCTAFASFRDDGTGCELYYGDKKDLLNVMGKGNGIIYIRGDASRNSDIGRKRKLLLTVMVPVVSFAMLFIVSVPCYLRYRKYSYIDMTRKQDAIRESASLLLFQFGTNIAAIDEDNNANGLKQSRKKVHELPLLSFSCIAAATNNFSLANKLGEGGFGPVYKVHLIS
ncbi:hypothetical protein F0562_009461 [Nyssa sinensis]|uniref:non-specific serine/threonine protein kinase n=1 Tax=Nyssa sinensis TaxID=561372 RepID=A0A5J4ZZD6_9ASTE|nr:hypothetical protein F0562_009461 [Nyssa sinensis]